MKRAKRLLLVVLAAGLAYAGYVAWGLPPRAEVRALAKRNPAVTGVMRQRAEEARARKRRPRRAQTWVPLSRVSRHLIHAVVVAEDPKFFGHEGVDWEAVRESIETDLRRRRFARGGSTITQQAAKNVFFTTRKSVTRKLRELIVARWLEEDLSKGRILEIYLNVIEWGDGIYGCEAAAERYYGRPASALGEAEAAGLAAMIPSPRRINPRANPARHARAQKRILWLMARAGYVRRDVGGLGAEPPPDRGEDLDEEDVEEGGPEAAHPGPPAAEEPATPAPAAPFTPPAPWAPSTAPAPEASPTLPPPPAHEPATSAAQPHGEAEADLPAPGRGTRSFPACPTDPPCPIPMTDSPGNAPLPDS